jgi:ABC-type transporter Mla maintaining outer membrane lipid asymmetry ATPase subunit MlaF
MYVLDVIRQGQPRNLHTFVIRKQAENNLQNICLQALVAKKFDKVLSGRMSHQRAKIFRHFWD